MKQVYVILCFHAHEPLWDFPGQLQALADREEIRSGVTAENYLRRRKEEGRDLYLDFLEMGRRLNTPLCLEASNELLFQLEQITPETFSKLKAAFREGALHPILGHAHHTHITLLTEEEIYDELRLNAEFYREEMGVALPAVLGAFPTEGSLDSHKLEAYRSFGLKYLVFPHLHPDKCRYRVLTPRQEEAGSRPDEVVYRPFRLGNGETPSGRGLLGLPRNFPISQEIWRPVTRMHPKPLRAQGYLLGDYPVFPEEYRGEARVSFPVSHEEGVAEYARILLDQLDRAPDKGLLLYIQDLELMDFGDAAFKIMEEAWQRVIREEKGKILFTTPQEYLEREGYLGKRAETLYFVEFDQISWAPEIRPVLRTDGHYPPLGSGEVGGVDVVQDYLRDWPLAFWEPGRYFSLVTNFLMDQAGFDLTLPASAGELRDVEYHPTRLAPDLRYRLLGRLMKRACNWGWRPDEARQKRPVAALYMICQELSGRENLRPRGDWKLTAEEWDEVIQGLAEIARLFLEYRCEYLQRTLENLGWLNAEQKNRLDRVRKHQENAGLALLALREKTGQEGTSVQEIAVSLKDYCRELFLGTSCLQEVWTQAPAADQLITGMYHHLYKQIPPRFLRYLHEVYGENRPGRRIGLRAPQPELV
ncbi:MAG: glycoside hydrolase [Firmicutes bacterium]|nr:glycoside hydrolase [Bacillota bacterium]